MNRRNAPRREVESVERRGSYGNVSYHVSLSCGHIEIVKRKPPSSQMACLQCGGEAPSSPPGVQIDPVIQMQQTEEFIKTTLASRWGLERDSITVIFGLSSTRPGVRIELTPADLEAVLGK
jgi:hypothetical protein